MQLGVHIHHLFISPGHNFFGRYGQAAGQHPTIDVPAVTCRAGKGIEGDRFFDYRSNYKGQVTFFAWETYTAARERFSIPSLSPAVFRRNILIEGVELGDLIGKSFVLGEVEFIGVEEARPCLWMDGVVALGAEQWLKGRGGLRARVISDGVLLAGAQELTMVAAHSLTGAHAE